MWIISNLSSDFQSSRKVYVNSPSLIYDCNHDPNLNPMIRMIKQTNEFHHQP